MKGAREIMVRSEWGIARLQHGTAGMPRIRGLGKRLHPSGESSACHRLPCSGPLAPHANASWVGAEFLFFAHHPLHFENIPRTAMQIEHSGWSICSLNMFRDALGTHSRWVLLSPRGCVFLLCFSRDCGSVRQVSHPTILYHEVLGITGYGRGPRRED